MCAESHTVIFSTGNVNSGLGKSNNDRKSAFFTQYIYVYFCCHAWPQ
ncbi:protein of unknown function [Xenorhabdus poinarii G6]|uniref:Uncharacterized protein n=1 Tax=Xenorhabdus poinarii G6 TaxID=1354304 RepID=A0A068R6E7_9GAMM|nr:protein of unknown function [Xenorhabdus poinarii G6]